MSLSEINIWKCIQLCESSKVTERKKGLKELDELLMDSDAIKTLHGNTATDRVNWSALFNASHTCLVNESERIFASEKKGTDTVGSVTSRENLKRQCGAVITTIVKKGKNIKCSYIISACFGVFESNHMRKSFCTYYISVLQHVLSNREYWISISYDQWEKLLQHLLTVLKHKDDLNDWTTNNVLQTLELVVKHGCHQSRLGLDVKHQLIPFLEERFSNLVVACLENSLLLLTICVCQEVSKESRVAVCHLGEKLLSTVLDMYDSKCDVRSSFKNDLILNFMIFQVRCHHPEGSRQGMEGAYACCWSTWNRHLLAMYRIVINRLHRLKLSCDPTLISSSMLDLCVALCNQLFDNENMNYDVTIVANETFSCSAPKKRKIKMGLQDIMDELAVCGKDSSYWPWLMLISELLTIHPQLFKDCDISHLLDLLWKLQCGSKEPILMSYICKCSEGLIEVMDNRKIKSSLWVKIWETTLRTAGLNQNERESHSLIQALILKMNVPASGLENLLKMFQSSMIRISTHSLKTLWCLLPHFPLPATSEKLDSNGLLQPWAQPLGKARMELLEWTLPFYFDASLDITSLSSDLIANLCVMLTCRVQSERPICNSGVSSAATCNRTNFEADYIMSAFGNGLMLNSAEVSDAVQESAIRKYSPSNIVDAQVQKKIFDVLIARFLYLEHEHESLTAPAADSPTLSQRRLSSSGKLKSASDLSLHIIDHMCLVTCVLSSMVIHGTIKEDSIASCDLIESFTRSMVCLGELIDKVLKDPDGPSIVSDVENAKRLLTGLLKLYEVHLCAPVCVLLRDITPKGVIVPVLKLFTKFPSTDEEEDGNEEEVCSDSQAASKKDLPNNLSLLKDDSHFSDVDQIHLMCARILTLYCCSNINVTPCSKQETILNRLLDDFNTFDISQTATFIMITQNMHTMLGCRSLDGKKYMEKLLKIVTTLCRAWNRDAEAATCILSLLKGMIKRVSEKYDREGNLHLIGPFLKKEFGPEFTVALVNVFDEIVEVDKYAHWTRWKHGTKLDLLLDYGDLPSEAAIDMKDKEGLTAAAEQLVFFLKSPFHEVRLVAVKVIGKLFINRTSNFFWELTFFNRIRAVLNQLFYVEEDEYVSLEEKTDELVNRTVCTLHILGIIIGCSSQCSIPALLCLMRFIKVKNLDFDMVTKVFKLLPVAMKVKTIDKFLQRNMPFVLDAWFDWGFQIQDFPFKVMGFLTLPHFLESCKDYLLPILLRREKLDVCEAISSHLNTNASKLLEAAFPHIFAQYLPFIDGDGKNSTALKQYDSLRNILGSETIMRLLSSKLDLILIELLRLMQDASLFEKLLGLKCVWPTPKLPSIPFTDFLSALKYLQNAAHRNEELMEYIGTNRPSIIQQILLQVRADVCAPVLNYQRLLSLHQYCAFSDVLGIQIKQGKLTGIAEFVVRDVSHTLLYLIRDYQHDLVLSDISYASCRYLRKMYEHILPAYAEVVSQFLPTAVGILVPIAQREGSLADASFALLEFLIVNNYKNMAEAVGQLPPFSEAPIFNKMREIHSRTKYGNGDFDLQKEILHFLGSVKKNAGFTDWGCMLEGLQFLKKQLSEKKNELALLFQNLGNIRGFSEDCAESVLHQLVCTLIQLGSSSNSQVQLEAARCLGELGPADLTTLVLQPTDDHLKLAGTTSDSFMLVMTSVAHLVVDCLLDADVSVVQAAGQALYSILSTVQADTLFENEILEKARVSPFIPSKGTKRNTAFTKNSDKVIGMSRRQEIWCPNEDVPHKTWITYLVSELLLSFSDDDSFLRLLVPLVNIQTSFAEKMLPVLLNLGVNFSEDVREQICRRITQFFLNHSVFVSSLESSQTPLNGSSTNVYLNKISVQCMINSVNFIRYHKTISKNDDVTLDLNYLHVAQAAQFCFAYFSSIMYAELWCSEDDRWMKISRSSNVPPVDEICENAQESGTVLQTLLREAYQQIGDHDALYGCGSSVFLNPATRVKYYEHVEMWNQALLNYDMKLRDSSCFAVTTVGFVNALKQSGLLNMMGTFLSSLPAERKDQLHSAQFECMWRIGQWESPVSPNHEECDFEQMRFLSLKSIHDGDKVAASESVERGRFAVLSNLGCASLESCNSIYSSLMSLQALQEIEDIISCTELRDVLIKWNLQRVLPCSDFRLSESIAAQQARVLESFISHPGFHENSKEEKKYLVQALVDLRLLTAKLSREEGKSEIADLWLHSLSLMPGLPKHCQWQLSLEEAQLAWTRSKRAGSNAIACHQLRSLLKELKSESNDFEAKINLHARALSLYGSWMAESCSETPQYIIEKYMKEALNILTGSKTNYTNKTRLEVHCSLARFADLEYQRITSYVKSESFQNKQLVMEELRSSAIVETDKKNASLQSKSSGIDKQEIENTLAERDRFVELAMRHYLEALSCGEEDENLSVFRIVSIWFENNSHEKVLKIVDGYLKKIQSYKFVVLLPQLAARVGDSNNALSKSVSNLLKICAMEHPHHTLPIILALANSYKDLVSAECDAKSAKDPRVVAASQMLSELRKISAISKIVVEMEKTATAFISLAYFEANENKTYSVPKGEQIRRLQNLEHAMVPILSLPVRRDGRYNNIIGIHCFDPSFSVANGITKPKKIQCLCTDGVKRPILVKGRDDLRQDAVMQQVFGIMNTLLKRCKETKSRKLTLRTYKVVPLTQRCGILEWCEGTAPLGEILLKLHTKYYPGGCTHIVCRNKIENARNKSNADRLRVFMEICKNFHPAFRFFFTETFATPAEWFEHRLAYVHSVSTTSMVGYILGLGDRHVQNILVDKNTAEFVHIDFGIAFELGRILPTPETVPFRLTRDVEDGMGVSGIEGVFRRSCEKTMAVLRTNKEIILTILEVLLYDPLYVWTSTPKKVVNRQKGDKTSKETKSEEPQSSKEKNKMAERALSRLKHKLQGTEEGPASSVEGQVNRLIQEARDPSNLSRLFCGWQAYY